QARGAPGAHVLDDGAGAALSGRVAVEHSVGDARKELGKPVGDPLGPGADGLEQGAAAVGTTEGTGHALSAVVADEAPCAVVHGARNAAAGAAEVVAAVPAEEERREAAAGLEEDGLFAAGEDAFETLEERPRKERYAFLVGTALFAAQVHDR